MKNFLKLRKKKSLKERIKSVISKDKRNKNYIDGEFCFLIKCENYPPYFTKKECSEECKAFKFHNYLNDKFEPLVRKK